MDSAGVLHDQSERLLEASRALRAAALAGDWTRVAELEAERAPSLAAVLGLIAETGEGLDAHVLGEVHERLQAVLACDRVTAQAVAAGRLSLQGDLRRLGRGANATRHYHLSLVTTPD